ncbi:MAG: hypothetical protein HFJ64_00165 [Eggerthellaceae bacterium]|nr:hypothetical protein [Eggerthellaceae bacterium]
MLTVESERVGFFEKESNVAGAARLFAGLFESRAQRFIDIDFVTELFCASEAVGHGSIGELDEIVNALGKLLKEIRIVYLVHAHIPEQVRLSRFGIKKITILVVF